VADSKSDPGPAQPHTGTGLSSAVDSLTGLASSVIGGVLARSLARVRTS
jgi:hypothetical protein